MDKGYCLARMSVAAQRGYTADDSRVRLIHFELAGRYSVAAAIGGDAEGSRCSHLVGGQRS